MRFYASPADEPSKPVDRATVQARRQHLPPVPRQGRDRRAADRDHVGSRRREPSADRLHLQPRPLRGGFTGHVSGGGRVPIMHVVFWGVALMIVIPIITGVLGIAQTYYANLVGLRVMQDLRNALYTHLQHMPLRFFTSTRTGEIQSRLSNDVGGVQTVVTDTASSVLSNVVVIISTLIAMLFLSVPLTLLSLCLMPLFLWLTVKVGRARREVASTHAEDDGRHDRGHRGDPVGQRDLVVEGLRASGLRDRAVPAGERATHRSAGATDDDRPVVLRGRRHVLLDHARARLPGRGRDA